MRRNIKYQISNIKYFRIISLLTISLIISYLLFSLFRSSILLQKKERINLVFYGKNTSFYSFGLEDGVNYFASFFSDLEMAVPGGYGLYRLGGVGKLAGLEKKPDLFIRTFSSATSTFVDFYLYPQKGKQSIYFGEERDVQAMPGLSTFILAQTNASLVDRFILYGLFFGKNLSNFIKITSLPYNTRGDRVIFSSDDFFKRYQSYFYKTTYRNEKASVQILYTKSYKTSLMISQMLEGEGIRVVDISKSREKESVCRIKENKSLFSKTARSLAKFFDCDIKRERTGIYDILFILGEKEKEWEVE